MVGPKGMHDAGRAAVRHGHEAGEVTLGGRRVRVDRPRVRTADGESEVPLETYRHFADRDALSRLVLERLLAGVSARRFERTREPVGGGRRERGALDLALGGLARVRGQDTREPGGADVAPPR
jgi:putative transposase